MCFEICQEAWLFFNRIVPSTSRWLEFSIALLSILKNCKNKNLCPLTCKFSIPSSDLAHLAQPSSVLSARKNKNLSTYSRKIGFVLNIYSLMVYKVNHLVFNSCLCIRMPSKMLKKSQDIICIMHNHKAGPFLKEV